MESLAARTLAWSPVWLAGLLCVLGAPPPARAALPLVGTSTATDSINTGHKYFTHHANGHYWVAYDTGGTGASFNSSPDGVTWTSQGQIFPPPPNINPNSFANEWAMRYLGNTVIAAAYNAPTFTHYYRSGTLNSDGTVTWSGAMTPVGPADATFNALNLLIANGRPIMWRDNNTAGGAGAIWRGSAIVGPVWTKTTSDAPAMTGTSNGIFTAGSLFPTGGANPDDLIVLRATTVTPYVSAGSNRLVAMKWNAATDTYDPSWYNVSTVGSTLTEDLTTEVQVSADNANQKRFAAVRDSSGNLHAVYVNRNDDMVHYRKAVGFNNSWTRVSAGINPPAETIDRVGLTALANNNLYLFYSKGDNRIYYRRYDGASWGPESLLLDINPMTLRRVLAPPEIAIDCSVGIAFVEGTASPFNIRFTLGVGSCSTLQTALGAGTVTVTAPGSFEMTFDKVRGGGLANFYDLAEDPVRAYDLAGKPSVNFHGLFHSSMMSGGTLFATGTNSLGAKLDLLEATATRVRVRQEAFFQTVPPATSILGGVKGMGEYSVYPQRVALQWNRRTTLSVPQSDHPLEIAVRREVAPDPRDSVSLYTQTDNSFPNSGGDDFVLSQHDVAGVRTDILAILYADWPAADNLTVATTAAYFSWRDSPAVTPVPAGTSEKWDFLIHYKPTNFLSNVDPAVTSRSNDFRGPSALATLVGGSWSLASENTGVNDDFNEAEGAYALTLDPAGGLRFRIDGSVATPRYSPFFKIRQWRSLAGPPSVTLQGTPQVAGVDYRADVKPLSRAHWANTLAWHCTLQDPSQADTCTPSGTADLDVGSAGAVAGVTVGAGRYGNGALINGNGQYIVAGTAASLDFNPNIGAVEFWYQPNYAHTDLTRYLLWQNLSSDRDCFLLEHTAAGALRFAIIVEANNSTCSVGGTTYSVTVPVGSYSWRAGDWVHLKTSWDSASFTKLRLFLDGVEVGNSPSFDPALIFSHGATYFGGCPAGNCGQGTANANGIIDEPHIYIGALTPQPLAGGGLVGAAEEFLADSSGAKNFSLSFLAVDLSRRGHYFYLGADSQFRGLNVGLDTLGAGVAAGDLDWEYWDGTNWVSMESGFTFTDTTNSFTSTGNLHWTDLFNWSPYSVSGGPDLYYVRAHLMAGSAYSAFPREGLIKTDILLFQFCGDINALGQEFAFAAPVPTAVELQSFTAAPADGAVDLSWATASELQNLGFHLYRADSLEGPYTRITSSLIPGLGSSPTGQSYAHRDAGLVNGRTYHYELEDVETTGRTERHGPASATPSAPSGTDTPPVQPGASGTSYGDPSSVALREVERSPSHVVLELVTGGFWASAAEEGRVRLRIPGFESVSRPGEPSLPMRRSLVEAAAGNEVRLASVLASDDLRFPGLRPVSEGAPGIEVSEEGTVLTWEEPRREGRAFARVFPEQSARLVGTSFQRETKKAEVLLFPLRWDGSGLILSRRLLVRLEFTGVEGEETSRGGSQGRRRVERPSHAQTGVVAQLVVKEKGLQRVSYEEVFGVEPGRRRRGLPESSLRLSRQGKSVALHVDPQGTLFGPGSSLYFLSEGPDLNPYGDAVYELETNTNNRRLRMEVESLSSATGSVSEHFPTLKREENHYYQAGLLEAPDLWLWDVVVSPGSKSFPFTVSELATSSSVGRLSLVMQGASDFEGVLDHHVRVKVNGVSLGETTWDGRLEETLEVEVPAGVLREGVNALEVEDVGDAGAAYSMVFLNRFSVSYPRRLVATQGQMEGRFESSGQAEIEGLFASSFVLDTTDVPKWLTGAVATANGLSLSVEGGRSYLLTSTVVRPEVRRLQASSLKSTANRADYLLLGPQAFLGAAQPLLDFRESQGLVTKAVSLEEVYEQFGHGEASPEAIKEFLEYAYHFWAAPSLRYVLLLGDASYDPKDNLQTGVKDWLPGFPVRTSYLWTVSDPAYASVNGNDLLPDLAIGRLPAGSLDEARTLVEKVLGYENGGGSLDGPAVLVADNGDLAGNFEANADEIAATFLASRNPTKIYYSVEGANARTKIRQSFDDGASLMSYVGHGGTAVWATENIFNYQDVATLQAQPQQPLLLTLNCLNGFFQFPPLNSLSEALLKAEGKGVVAAFSPSGLSVNDPAHQFHKALLEEIVSGRHERIGDAVLAAQEQYATSGAFPELLSIYHLFGDPALTLASPQAPR